MSILLHAWGKAGHAVCWSCCLQARMEAESALAKAQDLQQRLGELQQAAQVGIWKLN
jgi:hypothetical protein